MCETTISNVMSKLSAILQEHGDIPIYITVSDNKWDRDPWNEICEFTADVVTDDNGDDL